MEEKLFEKLQEYDEKGIYPCHMPGHKRQSLSSKGLECVKMDITEIDGFDNLHHPEEILKLEEERAARIYHAARSFLLINGSTCGNVSAILACVKRRGTILVARNCHKSVYNALYLNECKVEYVVPEMIEEYSVVGGITKESILHALKNNEEIQAVMITSPTYDGVISDVAGIAEVVHRFGIPLIVDEAHGAHFGLADSLPKNALMNGADVVIHSLHKTLPSFTQTAVMHVQGDLVDYERLARFQSMYQSTSPSYLLLASMSRCFSIIEESGMDRIRILNERLNRFYDAVSVCKELKVMNQGIEGKAGVFQFDRTKIVIYTGETLIHGEELYDILLKKYKLQMEMAAPEYSQAIMTFMDTQEGFERLSDAILQIDSELVEKRKLQDEMKKQNSTGNLFQAKEKKKIEDIINQKEVAYFHLQDIYRKEMIPKQIMSIYDAMESKEEICEVSKAEGRIAKEYIMLYPPGIPLVVPGEKLELRHVVMIKELVERGLNILGVENKKIKVVEETPNISGNWM